MVFSSIPFIFMFLPCIQLNILCLGRADIYIIDARSYRNKFCCGASDKSFR